MYGQLMACESGQVFPPNGSDSEQAGSSESAKDPILAVRGLGVVLGVITDGSTGCAGRPVMTGSPSDFVEIETDQDQSAWL